MHPHACTLTHTMDETKPRGACVRYGGKACARGHAARPPVLRHVSALPFHVTAPHRTFLCVLSCPLGSCNVRSTLLHCQRPTGRRAWYVVDLCVQPLSGGRVVACALLCLVMFGNAGRPPVVHGCSLCVAHSQAQHHFISDCADVRPCSAMQLRPFLKLHYNGTRRAVRAALVVLTLQRIVGSLAHSSLGGVDIRRAACLRCESASARRRLCLAFPSVK